MREVSLALRARLAMAGLALLTALPAAAGSIQSVCSSSGLVELPLSEPFATDPPLAGFPRVGTPRCIGSPGAVSSSISSDHLPGFGTGSFSLAAQSGISVDADTGISFSGFAAVTFDNIPPGFGIGSLAGTSASFLDLLTISPPPGVSGQALFVIPLHVTGDASTAGTVVTGPGEGGIQHAADLRYHLATSSASSFGVAEDTIGLTTTGETLTCGPAACGNAPLQFNETRTVKLPFTFDEEFFLDAAFGIDASFFPNAVGVPGFISGFTIADFSHTLTFGPATIEDGSGNVIAGVKIASDINYLAGSQAGTPNVPGPPTPGVPEPPTLLLLATALILGMVARGTPARTPRDLSRRVS